MPDDRLIIRTSDRQMFKQCRVKWDFGSKIRMNYEPVVGVKPLDFGTAIHRALEVYHDPQYDVLPNEIREAAAIGSFLDLCGEQKKTHLRVTGQEGMQVHVEQDFEERRELGTGMLKYYFKWEAKNRTKTIYREVEFEVPVLVPRKYLEPDEHPWAAWVETTIHPDAWAKYDPEKDQFQLYIRTWKYGEATWYPVFYQGRIDKVEMDEHGQYWIVDYKTAAQFSGTDFLAYDEQCGSYLWALYQMLHILVVGVRYIQLRKKVPHPPARLKNGNLSVAKNADTTLDLFLEECRRLGQDPSQYAEYVQFLTDYPKSFIRVVEQRRSARELDVLGERIFIEAVEMLTNPLIYPNPGMMNCNGCWFGKPCLAKQEQGDVQFFLDELFQKRTETTPEELTHEVPEFDPFFGL